LLSSVKLPPVPKKKIPDWMLANAKDYGHKFCPCYECRQANGLCVKGTLSLTSLEQIDYVRKNIEDLKKYRKSIPNEPTVIVDSPKGDKTSQLITFAGRKGESKSSLNFF